MIIRLCHHPRDFPITVCFTLASQASGRGMDNQRLTFSIEGHFLEVVMSIVFTYILLANKLVQRRLEI